MFKKILIANRGEIACRVIKTARKMGIKTVAVYSSADAGALHVDMADEAVAIGGAPASESYLCIDKIIAACKQTGAEAVHPGYGFLSENAKFCQALTEAGITFIGPNVHAIQAMGDKIAAKKLATEAGVSTVPGFLGALASPEDAVKVAQEIGYPVILKASAGGGGKGMRVARSDEEVREGLKSAMSEAQSSFGDSRVFIERYIENPRHIEIQVLGDQHGHVVALYERECSLQRRHQKVVEEAPSPFLDEATRKAMCEQAVKLAKTAGYFSAGTVEFIVAPDRSFYFLEMNTRLQVEHPVTELVTGLDLVEQMIRVAAGEKLAFTEVPLKGHAIEVRVYAEDPSRNFLPSLGRLTRLRAPCERDGIRVDAGVIEGSEISMYYDPMIAKLIAYGDDRATATRRMADALDEYEIQGLRHNLTFLAALIRHPRFASFDFSTAFLGSEYPNGFKNASLNEVQLARVLAVLGVLHHRLHHESRNYVIRVDKVSHQITVTRNTVSVNGQAHSLVSSWQTHETLWRGTVDGEKMSVLINRDGMHYQVRHAGCVLKLTPLTARAAELMAKMPEKAEPDLSQFLLSPMPGLLLHLHAKEGDEVKGGQILAVVEAMKMENVLRAPQDAKIAKVRATAGSSLAVDQVILEFAAQAAE